MVERVAKAIYEASPFRETAGAFEDQSEIYRRMCRLFARAAIEAMREPTDTMLLDGMEAFYEVNAEAWDEDKFPKESEEVHRAYVAMKAGAMVRNSREFDAIWRAMIDAALAEDRDA